LNKEIVEQILQLVDSKNLILDEKMSNHTSFRVGGCADCFVIPDTITEAADIVRLLLKSNTPFYILGNGSNILVSDEGYEGVIVQLGKGLDFIEVNGRTINAGAGALLSKVSHVAIENGLKGLVFASGIPGSIGGAVVMNAGAYGGEMKDVISEVTLFDLESQKMVTLQKDELDFGYRSSIVKKHPYMVLSAKFSLEEGNAEELKKEAAELSKKRKEKQPLEYPSAGSTFKRPEGYFAGKLIEDAGLKGYRVGGAEVSVKHSGFVINNGNATARDIITLINDVRRIVFDRSGVILEPEVVMLGEGLDILPL